MVYLKHLRLCQKKKIEHIEPKQSIDALFTFKYTVALYFQTEEELLEYAKKYNIIQEFLDAKAIAEYYDVL